jgi:peptidoglycan/xylan/chitin deacetylase (PgdA/CDA1 family)
MWKRELTAFVSAGLGISYALERMPKRKLLLVLNYHRVGTASETPYDPGVFSATGEEFERQIAYLKRHFHMATLDETIAIAHGQPSHQASVLITFDDGYRDNYSVAFPILRSHGVQGVFFLPTSFIGTDHVPWWDLIAFIVKQSRSKRLRLKYPHERTFNLSRCTAASVIREVIRLYRLPATTDPSRFLGELLVACGVSEMPNLLERCFMTWDEVREMARCGMAFGSHTHSHQILSELSAADELDEICRSRQVLEENLNSRIASFAYPSGDRGTFSERTAAAVKANGYRIAFSFYGGVNRPGEINPYNVCRGALDNTSHSLLRLQSTVAGITGAWWD